MRLRIVQMSDLDEGEVIQRQAEVEVDSHGDIVEAEPLSDDEVSSERQRGPATMGVRVTPADPGRGPDPVREPDPPTGRMQVPAAIMKWRPAPRIIRVPVPTEIAVNPMPAVAV